MAILWSFKAMPVPTSALPMPSAYFALVLREWGTTSELRQVLRDGVADLDTAVIEVSQQVHQIRTLSTILPAGWGLKLGSLFDSATHGPVGVGVQSAATVADALDVIARYGHVRTPFIRFAVRQHGQRVFLRLIDTDALNEKDVIALHDATLVGVQNLLRRVIGGSFSGVVNEMAYPRPAYGDSYRDYLQGELRFDCQETSISFDRSLLGNKSPLADPELYLLAINQLRPLVRALDTEGALIAHIRQIVASSSDKTPTLSVIASRLRLSNRTLVRRLEQSKTSYRRLVDDHRRSRAKALLRDDKMTVAEIGYHLGYNDTANFGRSCRRWFGCSAGQYRRAAGDSAKSSDL
jgi:AraC-like DNA-binding protein